MQHSGVLSSNLNGNPNNVPIFSWSTAGRNGRLQGGSAAGAFGISGHRQAYVPLSMSAADSAMDSPQFQQPRK
ncbi:MAG: hypothetical protein DME90_10615 [Verrucomicrobia bacterium]|nr:MAG: hypothetical protein DME90_10615 [Verrucomicrobiota bacterium]